jgi:hypothetical protein
MNSLIELDEKLKTITRHYSKKAKKLQNRYKRYRKIALKFIRTTTDKDSIIITHSYLNKTKFTTQNLTVRLKKLNETTSVFENEAQRTQYQENLEKLNYKSISKKWSRLLSLSIMKTENPP